MTLTGIHVPLITPFRTDDTVAIDALADLAGDVLDAGATGLVAFGTTAEAAALCVGERTEILDVCARICRERDASLIVGAGGPDTAATLRALDELAEVPDITAALVTVPSFTRPGEAGVLAHFRHLAAHSPVPLVIYHIPYRTGQQLGAATLRELGSLPGIVGVKYAVGGIDTQTVELFADLPADFDVLTGDDVVVGPAFAIGASGGILASANVVTAPFVELHQAWQRGDLARARDLGGRLGRLAGALFAEPNPTVIKGVLHATGRIPTADVRLPLVPAGQDSVDAALKLLAELGQTQSQ